MAYEISPAVGGAAVNIGSAVASPNLADAPFPGWKMRQKSTIGPMPQFWPYMQGEAVSVGFVVMVHGVPGTDLPDDVFPDATKPQHRLSLVSGGEEPGTINIEVALFHGSPGVKQGDDNWDQTDPSYQPQLRTNTLPHTEDPTLVQGTWKVNEVFLPPAGV